MRVRCVSDYVTERQRAALGRRQYQGTLALGLTIGTSTSSWVLALRLTQTT